MGIAVLFLNNPFRTIHHNVLRESPHPHLPGIKQLSLHKSRLELPCALEWLMASCFQATVFFPLSKRALLSVHILPDDMGMLYLSECRLRMAPTLGTLAGVITEGPWVIGVIGAVGVVGV